MASASRRDVVVSMVSALVGALAGGVVTVGVTDRQISASRRDVQEQIAAARSDLGIQLREAEDQRRRSAQDDAEGRSVERRASSYADFLSRIDRHLDAVGGDEATLRSADGAIFAALRSVQLLGSGNAYAAAQEMASRSRELTNLDLASTKDEKAIDSRFFRQQRAIDQFVKAVKPELDR